MTGMFAFLPGLLCFFADDNDDKIVSEYYVDFITRSPPFLANRKNVA